MRDIINKIIDPVTNLVGGHLPSIGAAIIILIIGWFVALIISKIVRGIFRRTNLDNKLAEWLGGKEKGKTINIASGVSKGIFYLIMTFVLVAFFQTLGITQITEPLNKFLNKLFEYAPKLLGACGLCLVAWVVATVLKAIVLKLLAATNIDERFGGKAALMEEEKAISLTKSFSDAVYWLVFLFFLPAILSTLDLIGILEPVQGMVDKILGFLPNILSAAIIFVVGWFVARIIQKIVTSLLIAIGTDKLPEKIGLANVFGKQALSGVIGIILYVFILIPVLIASLNALKIEAVAQPASDMLNSILLAIPNIFAACMVLAISYMIGRMAASLVANLLSGVGFNSLFVWLGLRKEPAEGGKSPSSMVGYLVLVVIMFFAVIEAGGLLGFKELSDLISQLTVFVSHITFGLVIFAVGLFLSNFVSKTVKETAVVQAELLALVARIGIIVLVSAIALRQMGLANEIIVLAFGLILGAIALAVAIAIGIGGREIAARELEGWVDAVKTKKSIKGKDESHTS